ncbi:ABC transporter ATP-binding protein [Mesoterricola silvestris]|uniref:ABC transporter ATP-binding protein n=1 Tax=Mesoterricola silvestris TaxID=2927979 RepID=A0AA48GQF9_9BACT|nr:ABC transporter ATP-binding protein [Mesoterricola silvestris]BDU72122.1 ABC transporter ATP-binding protein [Mesoterricola silvestris]
MANPKTPTKINARRAWREARELLWQHRKSLAVGLALMVVSRLAGLVLPASTKYLIDEVIGKHNSHLLLPLALAAGAATLVQALAGYANSQVVSVAAQRAIMDMRQRVQDHILRLPIRYFDTTKSGIVIARVMNDAEGIRNLVGTGLIQLAGGLLTAVLALGVLFWLNWKLTLATLVFLGVFGGAMALAFNHLRPLFRKRSELTADITGRLGESVGGVRILKVYVAEDRESRIFAEGAEKLFRNVAGTITGMSAISAFSTAIIGVVGVLIMVVGGNAIFAGRMTLGDLIMYTFFVGLLAAPVVQIANIGTQVSEAFAGLDRIRETLDMPTEDQEDLARAPLPELEGRVELRDVWFEYEKDTPVLRGISFQVPAGSTVALVGSSGSGKSTIIGLLMAFNHPQRGQVLVDGRDVLSVRLRDYRSKLGVVMQDNFLFDGSVADNIGFARPGATRAEIEAVGAIAHVDEFVGRFEAGYDTIVGERGVKLSGGQRQRVAIARAILADPRILILDEATSSLDSESEAMIRDGLRRLRTGRTTFVIAHRLSTIETADQILVVEEGRIVERGAHAELMALGGRYRQLHDRQQSSELDQFINPGEDFTVPGSVTA